MCIYIKIQKLKEKMLERKNKNSEIEFQNLKKIIILKLYFYNIKLY